MNHDLEQIIPSIKHFKLKNIIDYEIKHGKLMLTDYAHEKIHKNFLGMIQTIGGMTVIQELFNNLK